MLTLFALPKPFKGHIGTIQRNAITSWILLRPRPEIILFGDEEGTAEISRELGLRHAPAVQRNEFGTPLVNDLFEKAQNLAASALLCYVNADIILLSDFMRAAQQIARSYERFLMVGRRWDIDIDEPWHFDRQDWEVRLRALVQQRGERRIPEAIDYFLFSNGLYRDVPPLVLGRSWWDHWLVWRACSLTSAVVDASAVILAIHQNHDYSHHPQGEFGVSQSRESRLNQKLAGGWPHLYTIADARYKLSSEKIRRNIWHLLAPAKRAVRRAWFPFWWSLLNRTRAIRDPLGLRQDSIRAALVKLGLHKRY